jgi:hypothetical protein
MALFVALHQHQADRCPAADPQTGSMLLRHLSSENASDQGVTIRPRRWSARLARRRREDRPAALRHRLRRQLPRR